MNRKEDIVYYDFQGWPEYKMNLREVLMALGGKVEGDTISFDLKAPWEIGSKVVYVFIRTRLKVKFKLIRIWSFLSAKLYEYIIVKPFWKYFACIHNHLLCSHYIITVYPSTPPINYFYLCILIDMKLTILLIILTVL